jgi:formate hydrogenlyase transcriptional activator
MASVAYSFQNVFPISPEAERDGLSNHRQGATNCSGSYIKLDEFDLSQDGDESSSEFEGIIGSSKSLRETLENVRTVAPTDSTVLIEGETGTGKELIARAVHLQSPRRSRPFVKLNCAAIPAELLESELFGHERGAFTGAVIQRLGRFEAAHGGTLFLDEIGDMPLKLQSKLLRVLQEQEFERLGSTQTRRVDVRVVAATNQDLVGMVAEKEFRMDLYYRLNVFPIALPPLRLRVADIPMLVAHFARKFGERMCKDIHLIARDAMDALMQYSWPGNIRELQNLIERAVIVTKGEVLQVAPLPSRGFTRGQPLTDAPFVLSGAFPNQEREVIEAALAGSKGRISGPLGAADKLGMPRTTLESKIKSLRINKYRFKSA